MTGLVVDIVDLPRAVGSVKNVRLDLPAPTGLGTEVVGVPEGSEMTLVASLTSMDDGVLVRGRQTSTSTVSACAACATWTRTAP